MESGELLESEGRGVVEGEEVVIGGQSADVCAAEGVVEIERSVETIGEDN